MKHIVSIFIVVLLLITQFSQLRAQETTSEENESKTQSVVVSDDSVEMPYATFNKRQITGAVSSFDIEELEQFDNQRGLFQLLQGRIPGTFGLSNVRDLGNALVVVDGVPRNNVSEYNIQEVESVTVLRDAASRILYGAQADNGVIIVKTKRGNVNSNYVKVTADYGLAIPLAMPDYLDSYNFAKLYNEARLNDNKPRAFSEEELNGFANNSGSLRYPNENYYSSDYIKLLRPESSIVSEFSGGNKTAQYYLNLGYMSEGSLLDLGEGANENFKRLNMRTNIDFRVNEYLTMNVDAFVLYNLNRTPQGNFWDNASKYRTDLFPMLIPIDKVTAIDVSGELLSPEQVDDFAKPVDGKYLLGGDSQFENSNIYGDLVYKGYAKNMDRTVQLGTGFDFDMKWLTPGLSLKGYFGFDMFNAFRVAQNNQYAYYELDKQVYDQSNGDSVIVTKVGNDVFSGNQNLPGNQVYFNRKFTYFVNFDYNNVFSGTHNVKANLIAYSDRYEQQNAYHPSKNINLGWRVNYMFDNKYVVETSGALVGSPQLPASNRWGITPSLGLAWIASEEDFFSNSTFVNYLKLKGSWGIINTDRGINGYYIYDDTYQSGPPFTYNEGTAKNNIVTARTLSNPNLGFIKVQELNLGFESMLADNSIWLEANFFHSKDYDLLARLNDYHPRYIPLVPYQNYEAKSTTGFDAGVNFMFNAGAFKFDLGSNFLYAVPKNLIVSEPAYEEDYRVTQGKSSDGMYGFVANGFYNSEHFDADGNLLPEMPTPAFGNVMPGDLMYIDKNNDGVIDDKDKEMIGNSSSRFQFGINFRVSYKNFDLYMLGLGQTGGYNYYMNNYYLVSGNDRYSVNALNRWTPETAQTATHPRLTTDANNHNNQNSTFWLYQRHYFDLNNIQLSYNVPENALRKIAFIKKAKFFAQAYNAVSFSPIKEKRNLNVAGSPKMAVYSVGLSLEF